ncbi:PPC domain-containing DNA-binding protein [Streptomyces sp. NPDC008343]|uniref:PPC domain-containing DNA-binding protein n=1 Tax=Streptomyces sp. NPDC008343 TaxID=3364828 RepID=UPI0036E50217
MKWQQVEASPGSVYVLVPAPREDALAEITGFAREQGLGASQVTAVGAFSRAVVGWSDRTAKDYRRIGVDEQCEILSLLRDIAVGEDGPTAHLHAAPYWACRTARRAAAICWRAGCGRPWR